MTTKADAARSAVERLANVQMNISLEEWSTLSTTILAALAKPAPEPAGGVREAVAASIANMTPDAFAKWKAEANVYPNCYQTEVDRVYQYADRALAALSSSAAPAEPGFAYRDENGDIAYQDAHPAPATVESARALPYLVHLARQRWDGNWSYTLEELAERWLTGQFHRDAAESDAKAAALSATATEGRKS